MNSMTNEDRQFITDQINGVKELFQSTILSFKENTQIQLDAINKTLDKYYQDLLDIFSRLGKEETSTAETIKEVDSLKLQVNDLLNKIETVKTDLQQLDKRQSGDEVKENIVTKHNQNLFQKYGLLISVAGVIVGALIAIFF